MFDFLVPKFIKTRWVRIFFEALILAIIIAIIISVFRLIINKKFSIDYFLYSILFGVLIGYFISGSLFLLGSLKHFKEQASWVRWIGYYTVTLSCSLIASEIGRYIISKNENFNYIFLGNISSILFNAAIAFIATTVIGLYQSQRERFHLQIAKKELDIIKIQQLKTTAELETLQSRINPHFLYNSLNSIASLIHDKPDLAEEMTLRLSKLFRYSINSQNESKTTVKEEIDIVQNYIAIETLRFGDRISFEVLVEPYLLKQLIPRFLIQPLVENAIKHGLHEIVENGIILIEIKQDENNLIIGVSDNGKPFSDNLQAGYGLQSTYDKLNLLHPNGYQLELVNFPVKQVKIIIPI